MSGQPAKDAKSAIRRPSVIVPIIVVLVIGTVVMWIFHLRLP